MTQTADASELTLFRDNVRRFIDAEILPHYEAWEKAGIFPREIWNKLGEQGFLAVNLPEEYGGFGATYDFSMAVAQEFARAKLTSLPMHRLACA